MPEPLQVGIGHQSKQVPVAHFVPRQDREVPVLLLVVAGRAVEPRLRRHVGLDADDGLHPMAPAGLVEVERTEHDAVIGQGEGRHAISRRLREEVIDPGRAVEQRELAVGV